MPAGGTTIRVFGRHTPRSISCAPWRIPIKASQLTYWNVQRKAFEVERVPVRLMVGASSADIKLERPLPVVAAGGDTR